ncbi:MAG: hypothetical protein U0Y82_06230 [Thermoleophilia bacterium]
MRSARAGLSVGALVAVLSPGMAAAAPPSTDAPLHVVYDMAPIARTLYHGASGVPGLGSVSNSARQYPLGDPFPYDRWLGKVSHAELAPLSAGAMVRLLEMRMKRSTLGPSLGAHIVAIDEVGREAQDDGFGPRLLAAMRIMAGQTDPASGQPMSRRVIMYIAPKMVANVGYHHQRGLWDSALAAAHLSGGAYLQMYHASGAGHQRRHRGRSGAATCRPGGALPGATPTVCCACCSPAAGPGRTRSGAGRRPPQRAGRPCAPARASTAWAAPARPWRGCATGTGTPADRGPRARQVTCPA